MAYYNAIDWLNRNRKQVIKSDQGFTLVELLVAMVILIMVVFAFTPLLVGSIERIHYAGDKSEALYQGQSEVEVNIAERTTDGTHELTFEYFEDPEPHPDAVPDAIIRVTGGLVDVVKEEGRATAWLSGFVPSVPAINLYLSPLPLVEGYDDVEIIVMGRDTIDNFDLENADPKITTIYDKHGFKAQEPSLYGFTDDQNNLVGYYENIPGGYDQYAYFTLSEGLRNSLNPYMPTIKWTLEGKDGEDIEVFVHTSLQVVLPHAAAVGSGQRLWISPNASNIWKLRSQMGSGLGTLNDIVWTGFEYAAVSSSGRIAVWNNNEEPRMSDQSFSDLNSITYGNGQMVAVSDNGQVITSYDGDSWNVNKITDNQLNIIGWNDEIFVTAGENGTIWSSTDVINWDYESPPDSENVSFKGLAYNGSYWLAVGVESGQSAVYKSSGDSWEKLFPKEVENGETVTLGYPGLNDIIHDGSKFVAVGDEGTIIESSDGQVWEEFSDLNLTNNLNAIDWGMRINDALHYIIVGNSGTIVTWNETDGWETQTGAGEQNIMGVAIR